MEWWQIDDLHHGCRGGWVCACVVAVDMFVATWVLHHHTKNCDSESVWYVFYLRTMYVESYVIWYRK